MAYSAPTSDFITSTLNGAIAAGDATITIGTGLDLPATNGILQIDYDSSTALGSDNGPETISYATYTSGTGALGGCTRGLNGTTGVAHANGAKVQCGSSASYWGTASLLTADLANSAITSDKIAADAVTAAKMANGMVKHRQGGTSGDGAWNTNGTNNTDTSAKAVKIQCGTAHSGVGSNVTVTFPEAFSYAPVVYVTVIQASNGYWAQLDSAATTTQVSISTWAATAVQAPNLVVQWIAIGQ